MCGWSRREAASASRRNRRRISRLASMTSGRGTFKRNLPPQVRILARKTTPNPPRPSSRTIVNRPNRSGDRSRRDAPGPDRFQQPLAFVHGIQRRRRRASRRHLESYLQWPAPVEGQQCFLPGESSCDRRVSFDGSWRFQLLREADQCPGPELAGRLRPIGPADGRSPRK